MSTIDELYRQGQEDSSRSELHLTCASFEQFSRLSLEYQKTIEFIIRIDCAKVDEILISEETFNQGQGLVLVMACEPIRLKGKTTSCKVYRLDGLQLAGVG